MSNDSFRAPAGWYPDPLGHPQLRWWNSEGWTEQVSPVPQAVATAPQAPSAYEWLEPERPAVPVQQEPAAVHAPAQHALPATTVVGAIEAPRAAAAPVAPAAYWDEDDYSTPAPSVDPAQLKFWSGSSPAEIRRAAREKAAREAQQG